MTTANELFKQMQDFKTEYNGNEYSGLRYFVEWVETEENGVDLPAGNVKHVDTFRDGGYYTTVVKVGETYYSFDAPYHSEYGVEYDCVYSLEEVKPKEVVRTEWVSV